VEVAVAKAAGPAGRDDLMAHGLFNPASIHWNLSAPELYQEAIRRGEGVVTAGGALTVNTGIHTGRSPKDKYIVDTPSVHDKINWGAVNKPVSPEIFDRMHERVAAYLQGRDVFVQDCFAGADPEYRLNVRVVTESAWPNLFAQNMFIRPTAEQKVGFAPDFTILHAPGLQARGAEDGLNSETFIIVNFDRKMVIIGGSHYAGEIKKSIFGILNYLLPDQDVMPMHCSANVGAAGDTAIFFGLSGTGKTTLSADPNRALIGDDEHGWSSNGVFNFEGGCYAKVINLSAEAEPEIYATTHRFGTVLENVVYDPLTRALDLFDGSLTENTRACYPLDFIDNASPTGMAAHPKNIIMLTADAFGVLPPISRLSPEQAMYHFLSGYTAKVAGTEKGMGSQPEATFSTCFGAPFMPRHPTVYGEMLRERIANNQATCWLVNTGWSGGRAGDGGERMKIAYTRAMVSAALDGRLTATPLRRDERFGLSVPENCPDVPADILQPRTTWGDKSSYDETAAELCNRFADNFRQFESHVGDAVLAAGIRSAA
jgi:phosphoenolpyruvate carboxykinase (ATP)